MLLCQIYYVAQKLGDHPKSFPWAVHMGGGSVVFSWIIIYRDIYPSAAASIIFQPYQPTLPFKTNKSDAQPGAYCVLISSVAFSHKKENELFE